MALIPPISTSTSTSTFTSTPIPRCLHSPPACAGPVQRWAVFAPSCLSFACVCYLVGLKAYLDVLKPKRTAVIGLSDQILRDDDLDARESGGLDQPLLDEEAKAQQQDEFIAYSAPVS